MGKVRLCVFVFVLFVQHQSASAEPSLWSSLFGNLFSDDCDSSDLDDLFDDSSDSDESKSDSSSSSDDKLNLSLTLPPTKTGLSVVVEKINGQVAVKVDSLPGSGAGDATKATTAAGTTAAAAATTTAEPTTTAKA